MGVGRKSRSAAEDSSTNVKLDSWKSIAAYLNRDPRTVQLWEKQEGFPVHRLAHSSRSSVYAFTAEIDAWLRTRSPQGAVQPPPERALASEPERRAGSLRIMLPPAAILLVLGLGLVWWIPGERPAAAPSSPQMLLVLPFQNQTSTDDSLADNLTQIVIADVVRLGSVPVISRQSSMDLRNVPLSVAQIASELHVSLVLRGTVAEVGGQVQVTVELLKGPALTHLWGATYRRQSASGSSASDQIASAIAVDVTRKITGSAPRVAFPAQKVDPRARRDYLAARFYWNQRDLPGLRKAIALYRQALAIDPKYAAAETGLAECYDLMTDTGVMTSQAAFTRAKAAAQRAISLDPNQAEAYSALAFAVYRQDWDFASAEVLFRKAISLDPDSAVAHQWYGEFLGDLRRLDDSIAELRKAKELDPLSPMVGADLADGYMHAGRNKKAEAELRRLQELYPDFAPGYMYGIGLSVQEGDLARAEADAQRYLQLTGNRNPLEFVRILRLIAAGKQQDARSEEAQLLSSTNPTPSSYTRAELLMAMGRSEEGYAALEQAYRDHSWWMVNLLVDPAFARVESQARFLKVVRQVGLPLAGDRPLLASSPLPPPR
ncbi:MAG: hypothetical protein ACLGPM_00160 [Acidobacteriota bacterium]